MIHCDILALNDPTPIRNLPSHAASSSGKACFGDYSPWAVSASALVPVAGFERDVMATATAPYRFSAAGWELANLPDKWFRRLVRIPTALVQAPTREQRVADVHEFFAINRTLRSIDRQLIALGIASPAIPETAASMAALRRQQASLRDRSDHLRPGVEESLESALADTLKSLGFQAWTGPFPPVDTVLTGSPTVLVTSPRDRIERQDTITLHTGLTGDQRDHIEAHVEGQTDLSSLVLDTGGIALYPSIAIPHAGLDFALEVAAHEWVHHWLWFRPLGRRYFQGGDLTTMNETVANIAGREIGRLARNRLDSYAPPSPGTHAHDPPVTVGDSSDALPPFNFQEEMRRNEDPRRRAAGSRPGGPGGVLHGGAAQGVRDPRIPAAPAEPGVLRLPRHVCRHRSSRRERRGAADPGVAPAQPDAVRLPPPPPAQFTTPDELAEYLAATAR